MATTFPPPPTEPGTYAVLYVATPAQPAPVDLPALHARLLPLAELAGHARLVLTVEVGFSAQPCYQAYGMGGSANIHYYILPGRPESYAETFDQVLEQRLRRAAESLPITCAQL